MIDSVGYGALRFTNGSINIAGSEKYGHNEKGAILSATTYPTNAGIQVTFKTVTYHGDSGGAGGDGADGISFFLQDGSQTPGLGAFGGSLAYSCSNNNTPHDGLIGGYIGLGIDEYGNFLNGTNLDPDYIGTNSATGDNSAYGYGYKPDRIGLRGAGSVSWAALTALYGKGPGARACPIIRPRSRPPAPTRAASIPRRPTIARKFVRRRVLLRRLDQRLQQGLRGHRDLQSEHRSMRLLHERQRHL